jgi:addiction module HigA family antidote
MAPRNIPPPNHHVAQQLIQHVHHMLPIYGPPTHPGEMLLHEFLIPWGMTQMELARRIGVSYPRVNEIIKGKRGVTPDTALRLARLTNMTCEFWLGLQQGWDLWHAVHADTAVDILKIEAMPKGRIYEEGEDEDDEAAPLAAD